MENLTLSKFRNEVDTFYNTFKFINEKNKNHYKDPSEITEKLEQYRKSYINTFLKYIENNYKLVNKKEIKTFIEKNPSMIEFMYHITPMIKKEFCESEYILEYYHDPEIENYDYLYLNINSNLNPEEIEEAVDKLLKFDIKIIEIEKKYDTLDKIITDVS